MCTMLCHDCSAQNQPVTKKKNPSFFFSSCGTRQNGVNVNSVCEYLTSKYEKIPDLLHIGRFTVRLLLLSSLAFHEKLPKAAGSPLQYGRSDLCRLTEKKKKS